MSRVAQRPAKGRLALYFGCSTSYLALNLMNDPGVIMYGSPLNLSPPRTLLLFADADPGPVHDAANCRRTCRCPCDPQ